MQNKRKKLEELNLLDDFLFNAMMTYPEMGEEFTRKILKLLFNKEFRNLKVIAQKSYGGLNTDLRGARLDVYVESDDSAEIDATEDASIMIWNRIRMIRQSMLLHFHRESVFIMQLLTAVA